MSTHVALNTGSQRLRLLLEQCDHCDARAGEPCRITLDGVSTNGMYICPDDDCEQLYRSASAAMSCGLHLRPKFHANAS